MRVNVIYVGRGQAAFGDGRFHRPGQAIAVRFRRHHGVTIGGFAAAEHLRVDRRSAAARVLQFLKHQSSRAPGDDEAVAFAIKSAGTDRRIRLRGERARPDEGQNAEQVAILRADDENRVLAIRLDAIKGRAERVSGGSAGAGKA